MFTRFIFLCASVLSLGLVLMGCQQEESLPDQQNQDPTIQVENSDPGDGQQKNYTNQEIADHLASLAADVPNVNDASSVVAGPYAVVGIDVDKDLDRSRVSTIKYSVAEALHHDPYGKTAIVIADADGMERIRHMADKIQQGHPVQGFVDELSAVVGRYMPEIPINDDQPEEPDQNKEVIPENEQQELDDIENDQSNQQKNQ
ncbi:YhcN/YlaJ family sporulation lipoprotein [Sediminibacillus dalangtanensis]|uniref:YhcN/YlaJ family sporulation lipoprotein n=1 Tax=Sediminibacillus dalangtanensis TaxID=2729421 RepID=A0ABX7VTF6_9BACI|nr:YhcN/YlaJ family sporulation lipoprotein [Sediminibacillus dalangtanensis]QTM99294.1 YhcN/YlaJ family sporulation lipoprotein [Sediminibacillus dalangtanensis]